VCGGHGRVFKNELLAERNELFVVKFDQIASLVGSGADLDHPINMFSQLQVSKKIVVLVDDAAEHDFVCILHAACRKHHAHKHLVQMPVEEQLARFRAA